MKKGFSLPLWVAGAAKSALKKLVGLPFANYELIKIPNKKKEIKIEIHSVGLLKVFIIPASIAAVPLPVIVRTSF